MKSAFVYVAAGVLLGLGYALLNTQTDVWANAGAIGRMFAAFHAFVDRVIPIVAGGLAGMSFHWLRLRARLAQAEARRADELRSRLEHVERDQAVWVVVASTLHELKNPLHALGLLVDELEDVAKSGDAASVSDHVARVRALFERMLVPLDSLRALARAGKRPRKTRALGATVVDAAAVLAPVAAQGGVTLRLEGDVDSQALVDPEYVRIIVDNLVANALETRASGGDVRTIVISIADDRTSAKAVVRISDDGPGVPESGRTFMFEPLHGTKDMGLGLGLPIARALARTLGGDLDVAAVPGFATTFELVLPSEAR